MGSRVPRSSLSCADERRRKEACSSSLSRGEQLREQGRARPAHHPARRASGSLEERLHWLLQGTRGQRVLAAVAVHFRSTPCSAVHATSTSWLGSACPVHVPARLCTPHPCQVSARSETQGDPCSGWSLASRSLHRGTASPASAPPGVPPLLQPFRGWQAQRLRTAQPLHPAVLGTHLLCTRSCRPFDVSSVHRTTLPSLQDQHRFALVSIRIQKKSLKYIPHFKLSS